MPKPRGVRDHHFGQSDDGIERRAQLVAHAGDELRLVLARPCELATLVLDFVELPHILDRDPRLVREGRDQLDLLVGEWPNFLAVDDDGADQLIFLEHWHRQTRPSPGSLHCRDAQRIAIEIGLFGFQVGNVDHPLGTRETAEA